MDSLAYLAKRFLQNSVRTLLLISPKQKMVWLCTGMQHSISSTPGIIYNSSSP